MGVLTIVLALLTLAVLGILWRIIKTDARTLWLGFWTLALIPVAGALFMIISGQTGQVGVMALVVAMIAVLAPVILFAYLFNLLVIYYSWQIWRKEYHTLGNLLLPLLFIAMTVLNFLEGLTKHAPQWVRVWFVAADTLTTYFTGMFVIFLVGALVYAFVNRKREADYYVVLGAGLIGGNKVGKLLANRIQAATKAGELRYQLTGVYPTIVFSGGKGSDEQVSEAQAMRDYAVREFGYPADKTVLEDKSTTTRENMRFSRDVISELSGESDPAFVYFTSEYHVFRASLQARQFGVRAQGRGGHTAMYYRITAFIREYIAVLNMHRRFHAVIVGGVLLMTLLLSVSSMFIG